MAISDKTLAEMRAGAEALLEHQGCAGSTITDIHEYVSKLRAVADRHDALKRWERAGVLTIETRSSHDHSKMGLTHKVLHHVKNGPTLEETPEAMLTGGYPSELLVAQIALAISSCNGGGNG